eukprot:TRINITY_DN5612_c3_g1_i1.p1 TRINITY_DN5612_c3_g1~~TRINITY_DN5612_c3_g1_i1.p1  ORF type:complete len:949 (+),score=260.59 TRINITY_DN5612_c3_g1_i1:88-2847(+)
MAEAKQLRWLTRAAAGGPARFDPFLVLNVPCDVDDAGLRHAYTAKLALLEERVLVGQGLGDEGDKDVLTAVVEKAYELLANPLTRQACVALYMEQAAPGNGGKERSRARKDREGGSKKERGKDRPPAADAITDEEALLGQFAGIIRSSNRKAASLKRQVSGSACSSSSAHSTPITSPLTPCAAAVSPQLATLSGDAAAEAKAARAERRRQRKTQLRAYQEKQKQYGQQQWHEDDTRPGAKRGSDPAAGFPASPDVPLDASMGGSPAVTPCTSDLGCGHADAADLVRAMSAKAMWRGAKLFLAGEGASPKASAVAPSTPAPQPASGAEEEGNGAYISYPAKRERDGEGALERGPPSYEQDGPARTLFSYLQREVASGVADGAEAEAEMEKEKEASEPEGPTAPVPRGAAVLNGAAGLGGAALLRPAIVAAALCRVPVRIAKDMTRNRHHLGDLPAPDLLGVVLLEGYGIGCVTEAADVVVADVDSLPPAPLRTASRSASTTRQESSQPATPVLYPPPSPSPSPLHAQAVADPDVVALKTGEDDGTDGVRDEAGAAVEDDAEVMWIEQPAGAEDDAAGTAPAAATQGAARETLQAALGGGHAVELGVFEFSPAADGAARRPPQEELRLKSGCIAQTALWVIPPLLRRAKRTVIDIKGQVDAGSLPCFAVSEGFCPLLALFGGHAELVVTKRRGGPINHATIKVDPLSARGDEDEDGAAAPSDELHPVQLTESGVLTSLDVFVWVSKGIPLEKGKAAAQAALQHMQLKSGDAAVAALVANGATHLHLWKEDQVSKPMLVVGVKMKSSLGGLWCAWSVGGAGTRSEHTGVRAAAGVLADYTRGGCISDFLQEHAAVLMAACPAGATSRIRLNLPFTPQLDTTLRALRHVCPHAEFTTIRPPTHSRHGWVGKQSAVLQCRVDGG